MFKSLCQLGPTYQLEQRTQSTMPLLTALVYNYNNKLKTYHKIKARLYNFGRAQWGKVRMSQPIVPASQRSGPSVPASQDVFTYIGSFKWKFQGQRQPEPPIDLERRFSKQAPSGWFFTGGNYYSWFQIPERELQARSAIHEQEVQAGVKFAHKNYKQDRASTSTTNLPWALKRANEMWKAIGEEREEMTAKRMKASKAGGA